MPSVVLRAPRAASEAVPNRLTLRRKFRCCAALLCARLPSGPALPLSATVFGRFFHRAVVLTDASLRASCSLRTVVANFRRCRLCLRRALICSTLRARPRRLSLSRAISGFQFRRPRPQRRGPSLRAWFADRNHHRRRRDIANRHRHRHLPAVAAPPAWSLAAWSK